MTQTVSENRHGSERGYRLAALWVCIGLVVAALLGIAGMQGPGVLSPESAFLVGGVGLLVVAAALVYMFLTYRSGFARLQERVLALSGITQRIQEEEEAGMRAQANRIERLESRTASRPDLQELERRVDGLDQHRPELVALRRDVDTLAQAHNQGTTALEKKAQAHADDLGRIHVIVNDLEALRSQAGLSATNREDLGALRNQVENLERGLLRVWDALANVNAGSLLEIQQRLTGLESSIQRLDSLALTGRSGDDEATVDRLRERLTILDQTVSGFATVQQRHDGAVSDLVDAVQSLRERVDAGVRDEKLWLEVQRLMVDLRQIEGLRQREEHFRLEVERFQNKLAEDHARIEDQFARMAAFQAQLEATRNEILSLRQEAQQSIEESRRLHATLDARLTLHEGHAAAPPVEVDVGDELSAIEGIGDIFQERLRADGILTFQDLREAYPDEIAAAVGTTPQRVRQWQDMAELMQVPGIGPQFAELLVLSEIRSVRQLAAMDPEQVLGLVQARTARRRVRITREPYDRSTVQAWIDAARSLANGVATKPGAPTVAPSGPGAG